MPFRDDQDAQLSRAEALACRVEQLQQQLEAAEAARDAEAKQNAVLQRELKRLRRERDKLDHQLDLRIGPPPSGNKQWILYIAVPVMFVALLIFLMYFRARH